MRVGSRGSNARTPAQVLERLVARSRQSGTCLLWTGPLYPSGYGIMAARGVTGKASPTGTHAIAWMIAHGAVPEGHQIHHLCGNKTCVNAAHLVALTDEEHRAVHTPPLCPRSHTPNWTHRRGYRECLTCDAERNRAARARA